MPTAKTIARIEKLTWAAIYVGLVLVAIAISMARGSDDDFAAWCLGVAGGLIAAAGFTMIYVRSRLKENET